MTMMVAPCNADAKRDAAYIKTANTETGAWDFVKIQGID